MAYALGAVIVAAAAYLGGALFVTVGAALNLSTFGAREAWNAAVPWFNAGMLVAGVVALAGVLLWLRRAPR